MPEKLIPQDKSIIVAADIPAAKLPELVEKTCKVPGIGGYKIGMELSLEQGLAKTVSTIRQFTDLPIVYDHQRGGFDTSDVGEKFARVCKEAGVNAVNLFPYMGPKTEKEWITACKNQGLAVIIGAHLIHAEFFTTEGGWVIPEAVEKIFHIAAAEGVRNFVVPGSKLELIQKYTQLFTQLVGEGNYTLYLPTIPTDKEGMTTAAKAAGPFWHGVIGRAITQAEDITAAAEQITSQL